MADYYNPNPNLYSSTSFLPPPAGAREQYYASPALSQSQHHYPGQDPPRYGSPGTYPPDPQQRHGSYIPPQDPYTEAYRASRGTPPYRGTPPPPPGNMQVATYRDGYDDRRSSVGYSEPGSHHHHHHHEHRSSDAGSYYDEPGRSHSHGGGQRGSVGGGSDKGPAHHGSVSHHHDVKKDLGASVLGAAIGAFAGHEVGHKPVATLIGAVAGGVVGHKLEGRHEKHKEEREQKRKDSLGYEESKYGQGPYAAGGVGSRGVYAEGRRPRRSTANGERSRGGIDSESDGSGSETDSSYERRHHHHH